MPRGIPDAIRDYGQRFRGLPKAGLSVRFLTAPEGPLSAGLAAAHNTAASAATDFARAKDQGLAAAGDGLVHIGTNFAEIDRQGKAAIDSLFPAEPPQPAPGGP